VRARRARWLLLAALIVAGCYPNPAGPQGRQIQDLYRIFFAASVVVAFIVWGLTTWAILRYRRRDDRLPPQIHGNNRIEIIWTAIPLLTVLGLFAATWVTLQSVNAVSPNPGVQIHVDGFRWQWRFDYTGQDVSLVGQSGAQPELVVPVGETIQVTLTATDVVHSFYVPALLYKLDAIPGRENRFDFIVDVPGTYSGACAELCGVFHDRMLFRVRAVPRPEYDAWLGNARAQSQPILASPGAAP
jgi:cytochrome c oxidase subunit 2